MRKITAKLKSDMISDIHEYLGDASDQYAARDARDLTEALTKPENASDLDTYLQARKKVNMSKTHDTHIAALDAYFDVINNMCKKYIPDDRDKRGLN